MSIVRYPCRNYYKGIESLLFVNQNVDVPEEYVEGKRIGNEFLLTTKRTRRIVNNEKKNLKKKEREEKRNELHKVPVN